MSHHDSIGGRQPKKKLFPLYAPMTSNPTDQELPGNIPVPLDDEQLLIPGQGCLVFTISDPASKEVEIIFKTKDSEKLRLSISGSDGATFTYQNGKDKEWHVFKLLDLPAEADHNIIDGRVTPIPDDYKFGIDNNPDCRYWVSIDSLNKRLRYGKGEMRKSTALLDYVYDKPKNLFDKEENEAYAFIRKLEAFQHTANVQPLSLWKDPVVAEPPAKVVPASQLTMDDVVEGIKTVAASLSPECQILYGNVAEFELNTPDFPDFAEAIEYSMRTEECIGYKILHEKIAKNPFGDSTPSDYLEVYLRITLGHAQGESPGIPYVMEIWPRGCASPIHHHGFTHAIIKVLRGSIDVDLHRMLPGKEDMGHPLKTVTFNPGDVTYLMPEINQYHLLKNNKENAETCITIQCYSYGKEDDIHHPDFVYVENHEIGHFDPISDYDFKDFKQAVKEEWTAYLRTRPWAEKTA